MYPAITMEMPFVIKDNMQYSVLLQILSFYI